MKVRTALVALGIAGAAYAAARQLAKLSLTIWIDGEELTERLAREAEAEVEARPDFMGWSEQEEDDTAAMIIGALDRCGFSSRDVEAALPAVKRLLDVGAIEVGFLSHPVFTGVPGAPKTEDLSLGAELGRHLRAVRPS